MQIGAAARRESDTIAAHQKITLRHRLQKRTQLFMRDHAGPIGGDGALIATREFPPPTSDAGCTRLERDRSLALPRFAFIHRLIADGGASVHDKNKARGGWQPESGFVGVREDIFVKPQHGMHYRSPALQFATALYSRHQRNDAPSQNLSE